RRDRGVAPHSVLTAPTGRARMRQAMSATDSRCRSGGGHGIAKDVPTKVKTKHPPDRRFGDVATRRNGWAGGRVGPRLAASRSLGRGWSGSGDALGTRWLLGEHRLECSYGRE